MEHNLVISAFLFKTQENRYQFHAFEVAQKNNIHEWLRDENFLVSFRELKRMLCRDAARLNCLFVLSK